MLDKAAKFFSILVALTMVLGAFAVLSTDSGAERGETIKVAEPEKMDIGPEIRASQPNMGSVQAAGTQIDMRPGITTAYYDVNETALFLDSYSGIFENYTKRGEGNQCAVWVADDLSFPEGDPRNEYPAKYNITDDDVDYIIDQFDNNIYDKEAVYFGEPENHTGDNAVIGDYGYPTMQTEDGKKVMIMISNIKDENYYDPDYKSYVVGYYSPTTEYYYDRNVIHIDCWDWENRTGSESERPFVYESTVAHEYQHLLHDDTDSIEETWLNEGISMYAETLCGYGVPTDYADFFFTTPDNGLTEWGDQGQENILADYGAAMMFMLYMNDHFGGASIIGDLFNSTLQGADSVTAVLQETEGYSDWDFDKVFQYWRMANLIRDDFPGDGWYNYDSIDWGDVYDLWNESMPTYSMGDYIVPASDYFGETYNLWNEPTGYSMVGSYGTDYFRLTEGYIGPLAFDSNLGDKFFFDGWDEVIQGWSQMDIDGNTVWYSGAMDEADFKLQTTVDLTGMENSTLSFDTWYQIETAWDFGMVQVSTDGGQTWTSLENDYTTNETDPNAHPDIIEQLPGLTGFSDGWMNMEFNMSEYDGQEVMLQFRYMTDWAYNEMGWMIDNVTVNDQVIDDADDVVNLSPVYPNIDFMVSFYCTAPGTPPLVMNLDLNHIDETTMRSIDSMLTTYQGGEIIAVVSPTKGMADYSFGVVETGSIYM